MNSIDRYNKTFKMITTYLIQLQVAFKFLQHYKVKFRCIEVSLVRDRTKSEIEMQAQFVGKVIYVDEKA